MIVTVTPNPAIDRTLEVSELVVGAVHRAHAQHVEPSGKGVNVTRALLGNGVPSVAVLPIGGAEGAQLTQLLDDEGVDYVAVPVDDAIRVNISIGPVGMVGGVVTKVNEAGPFLTTDETTALLAAVVRLTAGAEWVVASGTLARGIPDDFYAHVCEQVHAKGSRLALDSSGAALRLGLQAGPDLVKPNMAELAELADVPLRTLGEVAAAARELRSQVGTRFLVSLGADGALLVDDDGMVHAEHHVAGVRSTVGAGDNLLAGYVAGLANGDRIDALRDAVAWGSVAVRAQGSLAEPVTDADRAAVTVHSSPDPSRALAHAHG